MLGLTIGPTVEGAMAWLVLAVIVLVGVRFFSLCDRVARLERSTLRIERALSALVFDASTNATIPEYRAALEALHKELGEPWVASKREKGLSEDAS